MSESIKFLYLKIFYELLTSTLFILCREASPSGAGLPGLHREGPFCRAFQFYRAFGGKEKKRRNGKKRKKGKGKKRERKRERDRRTETEIDYLGDFFISFLYNQVQSI